MEVKALTWSQLRPGLVQLSRSQGSYGRLLENLDSMPVRKINAFLKENNVKDILDFIMVIEGQDYGMENYYKTLSKINSKVLYGQVACRGVGEYKL